MDYFFIKDIFCHKRLRRLDTPQRHKRIITGNESMNTSVSKLLESLSKTMPTLNQQVTCLPQVEMFEQLDSTIVH
jgi:hypothetical protein